MTNKINSRIHQSVTKIIGATASAEEDQFAILKNLNTTLGFSEELQCIRNAMEAFWFHCCHSFDQICSRQR